MVFRDAINGIIPRDGLLICCELLLLSFINAVFQLEIYFTPCSIVLDLCIMCMPATSKVSNAKSKALRKRCYRAHVVYLLTSRQIVFGKLVTLIAPNI